MLLSSASSARPIALGSYDAGSRREEIRVAIRPIYATAAEAVADIPDGASIAIGGFSAGLGCPDHLMRAMVESNTATGLKFIANGIPMAGTGNPEEPFFVIDPSRVKKVTCSFPISGRGPGIQYDAAFQSGATELELVPQGTLAERLRAGGAGIAAFYTPTGVDTNTPFDAGKEVREFEGKRYLLETAIKPDYALVKALRADTMGNLFYRNTARAFNPPMAMAAKTTIVEVEELVEPGEISPEMIVTPGIYVHRIVVTGKKTKRLLRSRATSSIRGNDGSARERLR
jgi:3-oxoacid CoA-transferase A subunit